MGLDISAYSNISILGFDDDYDEAMEDRLDIRQDFINPSFTWQNGMDLFPNHRFLLWKKTDQTEYHGFRAGSYSGYNEWRRSLCAEFTDRQLWEDPEKYRNTPFFEIINFSDCEGIMGANCSTELHKDFIEHRERYVATLPDDEITREWFVAKYDDWTRAFELGSQNGLVVFH